MVGPNGTIKDFRSTFSDRDGQFSSYLLIPKYAEGGKWKILGKSGTYDAELDFNIFEPQPGTCQGCHPNIPQSQNNNVTVLSPLKQFKSGISANNVICKKDLRLVIKTSDGTPACVKSQTAQTLIERGWAVGDQAISEEEAISLIKKQYPQLQDFPSDSLPPKIIRSEKSSNGWYVMFETQGSGRPIIEAKCFFVDNVKTVTQIGEYKPEVGDMKINISVKTCH